MIPKEKAKELVKEYSWNADKSDAKQCALICVDEILKAMYRLRIAVFLFGNRS